MRKRRLLFINLLLLQLFLFLLLAYNYIFADFQLPVFVVLLSSLAVMISSVGTVQEMVRMADKEKEAEKAMVRFEEAQKLITALRSRHHDFVNHLQVVLGFIQMGLDDEAVNYIKRLSKDFIEIEKLVSLERPEVAALISSKLTSISYVQAFLEIKTNLAGLSIPPEKMVSILGNLLDNALYQASLYDEKWIRVKIAEEEEWFVLEITNPGIIEPQIQNRIFEPGFTNKAEKGSGMGLFIVKKLVHEYNGEIYFDSRLEEGITVFTVKLPKNPGR